jgi:DNA-binding NarL/FixJ family response regulator
MKATCPADLTGRQRDVLRLAACGLTNEQMGRALCLNPDTVKRHLTAAYARIDGARRPGGCPRTIAAVWLWRREFGDLANGG